MNKAIRKLFDFDFSGKKAHMALVGPDVGGPANGKTTVLMKSRMFSSEFVEKMQQVQVTMELPDFLEKFFYLWKEDAKALASLMGYVESPEMEAMEDKDEIQSYLKDKIGEFQVVKSLYENGVFNTERASELSEDELLQVLQLQKSFEAGLKDVKQKEENPVTDKQVAEVDVVLQKALEDKDVELQKALKEVEELRKAQVIALRKSAMDAEVKLGDKQEEVFNAINSLPEAEFDVIVKALAHLCKLIDNAEMFTEVGNKGKDKEEPAEVTGLQKAFEVKYKKQ